MIVIETKIVVVIIEKEDFMADVIEVLRLLPLIWSITAQGEVLFLLCFRTCVDFI